MQPRVSVLMGVCNGERFLQKAVESILEQTFRDFEFIIVDDGSSDGSWDILSRYRDPRIRLLRNPENIGLTRSLNKALEVARCELIARQDADDISLPTRLERQLRFLQNKESVGVVGAWVYWINEWGKTMGEWRSPSGQEELKQQFMIGNPLCHGSVMFRRTVAAQLGFYRSELRFAQDYDLWLRMAEKYPVDVVQEHLYKLRVSHTMVSISRGGQQRMYAALAKRLAEERRTYGSERTVVSDAVKAIEASTATFNSRSALAESYLNWGCLLFNVGGKAWWGAAKMLWKAVRLDPLNAHLWERLGSGAYRNLSRFLARALG